MMPGDPGRIQMIPNNSKWFENILNNLKSFPMISHVSRWSYMMPDSPCWPSRIPDKWFWMFPPQLIRSDPKSSQSFPTCHSPDVPPSGCLLLDAFSVVSSQVLSPNWPLSDASRQVRKSIVGVSRFGRFSFAQIFSASIFVVFWVWKYFLHIVI